MNLQQGPKKMTIGRSGFAYVSTTTTGKLDVIDWQKETVNLSYSGREFDGIGVSIPGHHSQLTRHSKELTSYGIKEENQIMVDWDAVLASNLNAEATRTGFKGQVVHGDLINVVNDQWKLGRQVDVIDFDDTGYLMPYHLSLAKEAFSRDVKVMTIVVATRGNGHGLSPFLLGWAQRLKLRKYKHWRGNMAWKWSKIQSGAIETTAHDAGYRCHTRTYMGRSTMLSCIITKA